jgi:molybdenum cofactor biosynthesis protein B
VSYQEHQQQARAELDALRCGILTISDTRTRDNDQSGAILVEGLTQAGHDVVKYELVKDDPAQITVHMRAVAAAGCHVLLTNGGTGIARRDSTIEAIESLLDKRLPGFGELFRMLSYQEIGPAAMLSRATAGVYQQTLIFCLPGSPGAVRLALEALLIPELPHLVWETVRHG